MERERLVSVVAGRALYYIDLEVPSKIIPFRGDFPLIKEYQIDDYIKEIESTQFLEDLREEFASKTVKAYRIALLEDGFKRYLKSYNITTSDFLKMSNSDKSDKLLEWMNKDCIDFTSLTIK
ncbi:MAG: hypothetical protein RR206_04105 [Bacteroidaceae bacterium]